MHCSSVTRDPSMTSATELPNISVAFDWRASVFLFRTKFLLDADMCPLAALCMRPTCLEQPESVSDDSSVKLDIIKWPLWTVSPIIAPYGVIFKTISITYCLNTRPPISRQFSPTSVSRCLSTLSRSSKHKQTLTRGLACQFSYTIDQ